MSGVELQQLKALLVKQWPPLADLLDDTDLNQLWTAKFRNVASIQAASEATLLALPLAQGIVALLKPVTGQQSALKEGHISVPQTYSPSEPDAAKLTQPKEIAENLDTESGRSQIQAQLEYGALPLSPQGYNEVLSRFPDMKEKIVASHSLLASTFTALLLAFEPTIQEDGSKDPKGQTIYKLTGDVISLLQRYAKDNGPLRMRENRNTAFSTAGCTATLNSSKETDRPDFILVCEGLILLIGKEKRYHSDLEEAWRDIAQKLLGGYPKWSYLGISHIMCFAAAHDVFQFGFIHVATGEVTKLEKLYNLTSVPKRLEVMLAIANIFSFFQKQLKLAPKETRQRFAPDAVIRHNTSIVKFAKVAEIKSYVAQKIIPDCQEVWEDPNQRLVLLKSVYNAIRDSNFCRGAFSEPEIIEKRKRKAPARLGEEEDEPMSSNPEDPQRKEYSVKLSPVCFVQEDLHRVDRKQIKSVMRAGIEGFIAMHEAVRPEPDCAIPALPNTSGKSAAAKPQAKKRKKNQAKKIGYLHTDPRLPNFLWDGSRCLLADFENSQEAPFKVPDGYTQADWDEGTCESDPNGQRWYTTRSDLYQLGILLQKWLVIHDTAKGQICQFAEGLKEKKWTAREALIHPYFIGGAED